MIDLSCPEQTRTWNVSENGQPLFSDGPTGRPVLQLAKSELYVGEIVVLTCNSPSDDGNPDCNVYTWTRLEGNHGYFSNTNTYKFTMNEFHAGNYTCKCGNQYNTSDVSNTVEVIFLYGSPPQSCENLPFNLKFPV